MGCNCNKNKTATVGGVAVTPSTYRVMVGGRQVYENSRQAPADTVAARFDNATVLPPGVTA